MRINLRTVTVAAVLGASPAWATQYNVETIDYPGAVGTVISGINEHGRVVGTWISPTLQSTFGFTEQGGSFQSIGASLPCRPNGRCRTAASFINAQDELAGTFSADVDFPGAFVQRLSADPVIVQPPGYPNTAVTVGGLNDGGVLVGCYSGATPNLIFVQKEGNLTTVSLPVDNVDTACATGVNNRDQLVGTYSLPPDATDHGFVLSTGGFSTFDLPAQWGAVFINSVVINDNGLIVGSYVGGEPVALHGFLMRGGEFVQIDYPGALNTTPTAVNDRDEIVGMYEAGPTDPAGSGQHVFVLRNGAYTALSLPGAGESDPAINNRGEIVGTFFDNVCSPVCADHGFRATPVDE